MSRTEMPVTIHDVTNSFQRFIDAGGFAELRRTETPMAVRELEAWLSLVFPTELVDFYTRFEWADIGPDAILSVGKISDEYLAGKQTDRAREENWLPIAKDDAGGVYFVVCGTSNGADPSDFGAIIHLPGMRPRDVEYVCDSFHSFLVSRIEFWMEDL